MGRGVHLALVVGRCASLLRGVSSMKVTHQPGCSASITTARTPPPQAKCILTSLATISHKKLSLTILLLAHLSLHKEIAFALENLAPKVGQMACERRHVTRLGSQSRCLQDARRVTPSDHRCNHINQATAKISAQITHASRIVDHLNSRLFQTARYLQRFGCHI